MPCTSGLIGWLYLGLALLVSGFSILINNVIIGHYVWKQSAPNRKVSKLISRTLTSESLSEGFDLGGETGKEKATKTKARVEQKKMTKHQLQRLRLVSSQAFLFVASYVLCNAWLGTLGIAEALTQEEDEPQLMQNWYFVIATNAFFAPLQGFLNMLVYIRPKYLKNRQDFPLETKLWTARRAVFGLRVRPHRIIQKQGRNEGGKQGNNEEEKIPESIEPTKLTPGTPTRAGVIMKDEESLQSLAHQKTVSSISISFWDFDQDSEGSAEEQLRSQRWTDKVSGEASNAVPTRRRTSLVQNTRLHSSLSSLGQSLPFISEVHQSEFEIPHAVLENKTIHVDDTSRSSDDLDDIGTHPQRSSDSRWGSADADVGKASQNLDGFKGSDHRSSTSSALVRPTRRPSNEKVDAAAMWAASMGMELPTNSNDSPMIAPKRVLSEHEPVKHEKVAKEDELLAKKAYNDNPRKRSLSPKAAPLVAPKRIPSEVEPIETTTDSVEEAPVPLPRPPPKTDSTMLLPQRCPSELEHMDHDNVVQQSSFPVAPPQQCPDEQETKLGKKKKKKSTSPNHSPVLPRRVPTEHELCD